MADLGFPVGGGRGPVNQVPADQGETSTVLIFVNAVGRVCPPKVIHKGQCVQREWAWTPTWALFGKNVCKNERIRSHGGGGQVPGMPPRSANAQDTNIKTDTLQI